jgi:hypothetical protein
MRRVAEAHRRLSDRDCPLPGMFVYFYKPLAKEAPPPWPALMEIFELVFSWGCAAPAMATHGAAGCPHAQ